MMQLILYIMILMLAFMFMQMNHPLSMGMMLLLQTVMICCISGMMTKSFWFSYILFLIFIGGMLVLFIYVTSLASNEMFNFSMKMLFLLFINLLILTILIIFMDKMILMFNSLNNEMTSISMINNYIAENTLNLNKLYNYPTNMINILLINYLLITLIATVKITKLFYGPIRSMN
uniref:NADH-ubiquinone oxidoreductase chain 6 n=2 Tax=Syrphini TaxID=115274 RepID=A0A7L7T8I5_SYRVI|nr:NADH dehydrogenase subunit 6 [Syrphus vitripennis]QOC71057.1 NADH dehydrogenase subunit 6 [Syrphus vitripennis]UEK75581.1 NADH dehydrogenase subunit 6 [Eupeodes latifasciatus]UXF58213.1 NADH dehydrogenase subunit 6 [Syrphus vitripennis]WCJ53301.1 NADH dehydrogenase subunit 6 [Syrphus vitripennis]